MDTHGQGNNVVGAVVFFSYIAAALLFTGRILSNISRMSANKAKYSTREDSNTTHSQRTQLFSALSVLSFAVLSYHMLRVLIVSFTTWVQINRPELVGKLLNFKDMFGTVSSTVPLIWDWATSSTLFRDFAEAICMNEHRFWWTSQTLIYTLAWNTYMSVQGVQQQIPELWTFFVLDQILPVSFTQNLFYLACSFSQSPATQQPRYGARPLLQSLVPLLYYISLGLAPQVIGTVWFMPVLLLTRLLLFAPLLILSPSGERSWRTPIAIKNGDKFTAYTWNIATVCVGGCITFALQTLRVNSVYAAVQAINDDPALSALSNDYLIGIFSTIVWAMAA